MRNMSSAQLVHVAHLRFEARRRELAIESEATVIVGRIRTRTAGRFLSRAWLDAFSCEIDAL